MVFVVGDMVGEGVGIEGVWDVRDRKVDEMISLNSATGVAENVTNVLGELSGLAEEMMSAGVEAGSSSVKKGMLDVELTGRDWTGWW